MKPNADQVLQWTTVAPTRSGNLHVFKNDIGAATRSLLEYGEWAWNEITFMLRFVERGATIIDVGAYVGTHTLAFADHVGAGGRVYSIEAQPASFEVLKRNIADNGIKHANVIHAAAAATLGVIELDAIDVSAGYSFGSAAIDAQGHIESGQSGKTIIQIPAITLDSLQIASAPALIKIDVEGMESAVLEGARELLFKYRPVIYAECNSVDAGAQTLKCLRQFGYAAFAHVVDAFNPDNWKKVAHNMFGPAREVAIVGIPLVRRADALQIQPRHFEDLFELQDLDDLCSALLLKPQYPSEILQHGTAAASPRFQQVLRRLTSAPTAETTGTAAGFRILHAGHATGAADAVVLHLHYQDLWPEFAELIRAIQPGCDLYVSLTESSIQTLSAIIEAFPQAHVEVMENRGRDIAPRLALLRWARRQPYERILFLHGKKSPHLRNIERIDIPFLQHRDGDRWRRDLLAGLTSDLQSVRAAFQRNPKLGLLGPQGFWLGLNHDPNLSRVTTLTTRMGIAPDLNRHGYFAGSMFWCRPQALDPLLGLGLDVNDFESECGQTDGTLAHAVERLFVLSAEKAGFQVADMSGNILAEPPRPILPWLPENRWCPTEKSWAEEILAKWQHPPRFRLAVIASRERSGEATHAALQSQWLAGETRDIAPADGAGLLREINGSLLSGTTDWVGIIDAGDQLAPDAFFRVAQAIKQHPEWQVIYTDEDSLTPDGQHINPHCKPDFNPDYLRSLPYTGGLLLIRRDLFADLGGFEPEREGAEDYDLLLRAWEQVGDHAIGHVPEVLYHRLQGSGHSLKSVPEILAAGQAALEAHLRRCHIDAEVQPGPFPPSFRARYRQAAQPLVSILIPTRDQLPMLQRCVESIIEKTKYPAYEIIVIDNDSQSEEARAYLAALEAKEAELGGRLRVLRRPGPFNFSAMNNSAARAARGDFLLLLNNDTAALHDDWLDEMMSHALRPEVGIVGAKLLFPDGRIQHAGVILGMKGPAEHPFITRPPEDRGYFGRLQLTQNYSAVTGACLLIRRSLYEEVGGLDEQAFAVSYNDIDLCIKVGEKGKRIVWTPYAILMHEGSASQKGQVEAKPDEAKLKRFAAEKDAMYARWLPKLAYDPAYNRHLSLATTDFLLDDQAALSWDPDWRPRPRILVHSADREGCGEYRIIAPMRALNRAGRTQGWETMRIFDPAEMERVSPDSVVVQRQMEWPQIEALERHKKYSKAFRVFEIDDLITNLPLKSTHRSGIHKDIYKRFRKAAGLCQRLVVATQPLAQAYRDLSDEVIVVPNYLEAHRWDGLTPQRRNSAKPRLGWAGGIGHQGDLEMIADVVRDLSQEVDWVFFGMCPEALRPYVREFYPGVPLDQYAPKLAALDLDLAIAPLEDNPFNEAKSHLRLLEYGILGYPVVCSDLMPYQGDFPVWRVTNKYAAWMKAIREALSDREALAAKGDELRQHIRQHWMLEDHLDAWLKAWLP